MEAFFTSAIVVALAEIGDKTQLLAIVLATRFNRPLPIVCGILAATIANHLLAAWIGVQASYILEGEWFQYLVAASFIAMGLWTLVPDTLGQEGERPGRYGAFFTTLVAFFLVEMGDKTQLATVALGARFHETIAVAAGTTLGMMLANVPAVLLGNRLVRVIPLRVVRAAAAILFVLIGSWILAETMGFL